MLVEKLLLHGFLTGGECLGVESHEGQFFQHHRVMDGIVGVGAPGEGAVGMDQDSGDVVGGFSFKGFDDDIAGFLFVCSLDF